ncbi:MAG: hypothetical protein R3F55_00305 [Alphaproteobacteria bacterium]
MRKYLARRAIRAFGARYGYDVAYMHHMLETAPAAFFRFAQAARLARHRDAASRDAAFAAKLVGALAEDCGPCVQLVVDMAREAGMAPDQVQAVLTRDIARMGIDTALGFRFADAVARRDPAADAARDAVRARWGEAGVLDLTLSVQIGRLFPMVKMGLGYAHSCQRVRVDDRPVDVIGAAAVPQAA